MAASPRWKVYDSHGEYQGSVKDLTMAGALMCVLGDGATVRAGHRKCDIVYTEGTDGDSGDSYDAVGEYVTGGCYRPRPYRDLTKP